MERDDEVKAFSNLPGLAELGKFLYSCFQIRKLIFIINKKYSYSFVISNNYKINYNGTLLVTPKRSEEF